MCIISQRARVANTRIFVALNQDHSEQLVVYSNRVATEPGAVMILPVPNPATVRLIDLSKYPTIFDDLNASFETLSYSNSRGGVREDSFRSELPVTQVGGYAVTMVPSPEDLDRVSRVSFGDIAKPLQHLLFQLYPQFGFVVCRLNVAETQYHPIAYAHRPPSERRLFVPTYHVHGGGGGGGEEATAHWDHEIYALNANQISYFNTTSRYGSSRYIQRAKIPFEFESDCGGVVTSTPLDLAKITLRGEGENYDVLLEPTKEARTKPAITPYPPLVSPTPGCTIM